MRFPLFVAAEFTGVGIALTGLYLSVKGASGQDCVVLAVTGAAIAFAAFFVYFASEELSNG